MTAQLAFFLKEKIQPQYIHLQHTGKIILHYKLCIIKLSEFELCGMKLALKINSRSNDGGLIQINDMTIIDIARVE